MSFTARPATSSSPKKSGRDYTIKIVAHRFLAHLVERMMPVARKGPHLAGPASSFRGLRPCLAGQDVRTIYLINGAIDRALVCHFLFLAANAHRKRRRTLDAR